MTMTLIETVTLASSASSIEFTSIPQDGVDLLLVFSGRVSFSSAGFDYDIVLNNNTSTVYTSRFMYGTGAAVQTFSSAGTNRITPVYVNGSTATANTFSNMSLYIPNYTSSSNKSFSMDNVVEGNVASTGIYQHIHAGAFASTAPITSVNITRSGFDLVQHTTASLYKIS